VVGEGREGGREGGDDVAYVYIYLYMTKLTDGGRRGGQEEEKREAATLWRCVSARVLV